MLKENDYKDLSRYVYFIDSKHNRYDSRIKEGYLLVGDNADYEILKTEDNTTNGMQAMTVALVENGTVDTSKIVIAYAGTNPDDNLDKRTDYQTVIVGSKLLDTSTLLDPADSLIEGQVITAENFAEDIKKDYPHAIMTTTGHSLGEYIALYVAAENGWQNVGFNGPDPYNVLSQEAKDWTEENPGMLINYRNKADFIGNFGGNKTGAAVLVDMDMGRHVKDTLEFHNLSTWEFDKDGNVSISDSPENKEARQIQAENRMHQRMLELTILAVNLKQNSGGWTSNEKIYLNHAQALLTVEYISQSMQIGLEYIVKIYQDAIDEAEEIWKNGIELAQSIGTELSYSEILNALEAGGVTKYSTVFEPRAYYGKKITEALEIGESFDLLASEIKTNIEKLVKTDEDLATQIKQGA